LRLPFSSPPTTRRVTVEVFYPASTRAALQLTLLVGSAYTRIGVLRTGYETSFFALPLLLFRRSVVTQRIFVVHLWRFGVLYATADCVLRYRGRAYSKHVKILSSHLQQCVCNNLSYWFSYQVYMSAYIP
jgi:hypothetical protein